MSSLINNFIKENIVWIIVLIFTVGSYYAVLKTTCEDVSKIKSEQVLQDSRTSQLEKAVVKMDFIQEDITEIKDDIKSIKSVILKPIGPSGSYAMIK